MLQDIAPADNAQVVRNYLDEELEHRVISHRGCTEWPQRSVDLTLLRNRIEDVFIELEHHND